MGSPSSIQSLLIDSSIHSQHSLQPTQEMYGSCRCWADQWECSTRGGVGIIQQICTGHNCCWFIRNAARSTCCRFSPRTTSSNPFSFCTHLFIICIFFFYWPGPFSETCAGGIVLRNRWYLRKVSKGTWSGRRSGNWESQLELFEKVTLQKIFQSSLANSPECLVKCRPSCFWHAFEKVALNLQCKVPHL